MSFQGSDQGETRCLRCGRHLRAAASVSRGYGRGCRARITEAARSADLSDFTAEQLAKAAEVIEQRAVIPSAVSGTYAVTGSDGVLTYLTDADWRTCTCRAGQRGRRCYHLAAALILQAAAPARRAA